MRHISLTNSRGESLDITTMQIFLHELKGFGYERDDTYRRVGNRWLRSNKKLAQVNVSGDLLIMGDSPYDLYKEFIQFCTAEPLTMEYKPADIPYYRECILSKCEKTEIEKYGALNCPVEFTPTTQWYTKVVRNVEPVTATGGWVWGTSSTWPIKWSADQSMSLSIESDSNMESPCRLRIYGPITNPYWKVYSAGIANGTGKVNVTVPDGCYLLVDNAGESPSIGLYSSDNEFIEDVYQSSDFSTDRFISLQRGINMINVYSDDSTDAVRLYAEGILYYESV